ncbi:MAG TPA: hypothetical protein VEJ46_02440 [Candidatus Acidoferrum sp.]|nr:hypothetical protein [Candidatus Acidoferrum sp.]
MPSLESMIGKQIIALVPMFSETRLQTMTLHSIENAGVWVENQSFINMFLTKLGVSAAPKTLIFFLPFHEIRFVWDALDSPSLSETGLGVKV